mgnify:FL=1
MSVNFIEYEPLSTTRTKDGRRMLNRPLILWVDGVRYVVPKGFVTDLSTIPPIFRFLVRFNKVDVAGTLHDRLYQTGEVSRIKADAIWRQVAQSGEASANPFQSWTGWLGIRLGGWKAWRKYRRNNGPK